ncbi:sulfotransferase family 2 domain-containing protein [Alcanivorax sp. DP30]|uniref:sulfotransferase family 2 domain-containing protein n=1 Tax=Alcanivorax sp. DP30 TaxID=2606217 RepID=UPI00136AB477|nr:sulfotransferase family 2 domain-containing protein [Alcanivorax sp. DP30]MZR64166.1 hypothetical protein [Alcanivorax sp. DP30]
MRLLNKVGYEKNRFRYRFVDNFYFVHINKTGGSSLENALKIPFEHKTASEIISEVGISKWERRFTFAIVRNTFDKVVSHFHYRVKTNQTSLGDKKLSFNDWVKACYRDFDKRYLDNFKMFMPQFNWVSSESGDVIVDFIGRFENLNNDFDYIAKKSSIRATLPHEKKSKRQDFRGYYDSETTELIASFFRKDLDFFNYGFDGE